MVSVGIKPLRCSEYGGGCGTLWVPTLAWCTFYSCVLPPLFSSPPSSLFRFCAFILPSLPPFSLLESSGGSVSSRPHPHFDVIKISQEPAAARAPIILPLDDINWLLAYIDQTIIECYPKPPIRKLRPETVWNDIREHLKKDRSVRIPKGLKKAIQTKYSNIPWDDLRNKCIGMAKALNTKFGFAERSGLYGDSTGMFMVGVDAPIGEPSAMMVQTTGSASIAPAPSVLGGQMSFPGPQGDLSEAQGYYCQVLDAKTMVPVSAHTTQDDTSGFRQPLSRTSSKPDETSNGLSSRVLSRQGRPLQRTPSSTQRPAARHHPYPNASSPRHAPTGQGSHSNHAASRPPTRGRASSSFISWFAHRTAVAREFVQGNVDGGSRALIYGVPPSVNNPRPLQGLMSPSGEDALDQSQQALGLVPNQGFGAHFGMDLGAPSSALGYSHTVQSLASTQEHEVESKAPIAYHAGDFFGGIMDQHSTGRDTLWATPATTTDDTTGSMSPLLAAADAFSGPSQYVDSVPSQHLDTTSALIHQPPNDSSNDLASVRILLPWPSGYLESPAETPSDWSSDHTSPLFYHTPAETPNSSYEMDPTSPVYQTPAQTPSEAEGEGEEQPQSPQSHRDPVPQRQDTVTLRHTLSPRALPFNDTLYGSTSVAIAPDRRPNMHLDGQQQTTEDVSMDSWSPVLVDRAPEYTQANDEWSTFFDFASY